MWRNPRYMWEEHSLLQHRRQLLLPVLERVHRKKWNSQFHRIKWTVPRWVCACVCVRLESLLSDHPSSLVILPDYNECTNNSSVNTCGDGGSCSNLIGSFQCICQFGYISNSNGQSCIGENVPTFLLCCEFVDIIKRCAQRNHTGREGNRSNRCK